MPSPKQALDVLKAAKEAYKAKFTPGFYHASPKNKIKEFDPDAPARHMDELSEQGSRGATFFTRSPAFAETFLPLRSLAVRDQYQTGATMYPVSLNLGKHFDPTAPGSFDILKEYTTNPSTLRWLNRADWSTMEQPDFLEFLKKKGYDSFTTSEGGVKNVGIFNPKNIRGKFAEYNPEHAESADFMKAQGGSVNPIKTPREMLLEMAGMPSMAGGSSVGKEMIEQVAKAIARYKRMYGKEPPAEDVKALKDHVMSLSKPSSGLRTGPQAEARAFHELATDPNLMFPEGPDPFLTKAMTGRTVKGTYLRPKVQDINDPNVMKNIEAAQEAGTMEAIPAEGQASITPAADYMARMARGIENAKLSAGKTPLIDKLKQDFFARHKRFPTDEELDMIIAEFNPSRHQYGEMGAAIVGERPPTARGMADWKQRARTEGIEERYLERSPTEYPQYLKDELQLLQGQVPKKAEGRSVRDMEAELAMANREPKRMRGYEKTLQAARDFMSGMRDAPMHTARGYMDIGEMLGMYEPKRSDETYMSAPQGRFIPQMDTQSGAYQTGANVASLLGDPLNYLFALPYGRMAKAAGQAMKSRPVATGAGLSAVPVAAGPTGYRSVMEDYK